MVKEAGLQPDYPTDYPNKKETTADTDYFCSICQKVVRQEHCHQQGILSLLNDVSTI